MENTGIPPTVERLEAQLEHLKEIARRGAFVIGIRELEKRIDLLKQARGTHLARRPAR